MSVEGVKLTAEAFSFLQETRRKLLQLGTEREVMKTKSAHQDLMLARLMLDANDAIKDDFSRITMLTDTELEIY